MNLKALRYFCEVVETASANVAASRLHVVPAAVSMQLAQLEAELGGKLFDRSSRPMKLTALGRFLYPKAKAVLSDTQRMLEEARDLAAGRFGWLSIGFTRSTIFSVLPDAVRALGVSAPKLRVDLAEILTEHQSEALRSGRIHVGLARAIGELPLDDDMCSVALFDDPLLIALPYGDALARKDLLQPEDVQGMAYVSYPKDPNSSFSRHAVQSLEQAGAKPQVRYEAQEIHTALGLVAAGLGFTLVGRSVADHNRRDIRFLSMQRLETTARVFAMRQRDTPNALVDAFLEIVLAQAQSR